MTVKPLMMRAALGLRLFALVAMAACPAKSAFACGANPITTAKPVDSNDALAIAWPVNGRLIVSTCSPKSGPSGIDIAVPEGSVVRAAADGIVLYAGDELSRYPKLILIRHDAGWVTAYAFNSVLEVARGDRVRRGQPIARSGHSPVTGIPELRFEVVRRGIPIDPRLLPMRKAAL